jgi:hypothetical protein
LREGAWGTSSLDEPIEVSTNLVDWSNYYQGQWLALSQVERLAAFPQWYTDTNGQWVLYYTNLADPHRFFVRAVNRSACIEQLRSVDWATQQWGIDRRQQSLSAQPIDSDLFGPGAYLPTKPVCPAHASYMWGTLGTRKPACSLFTAGHTL